jgi:hypothetical protein
LKPSVGVIEKWGKKKQAKSNKIVVNNITVLFVDKEVRCSLGEKSFFVYFAINGALRNMPVATNMVKGNAAK